MSQNSCLIRMVYTSDLLNLMDQPRFESVTVISDSEILTLLSFGNLAYGKLSLKYILMKFLLFKFVTIK